MRQSIIPAHKILHTIDGSVPHSTAGGNQRRHSCFALASISRVALIGLTILQILPAISAAKTPDDKDLPDAPSISAAAKSSMTPAVALVSSPKPAAPRTADAKFFSLAIVSTGSAFADSYTTLFARENWLAGKKGVCNVEVESAYLYGTHPTVMRSYAVASVKSAGAIAAAYYLRKHHSKLWSLPLAANAVMSLQGVTQNMITCN